MTVSQVPLKHLASLNPETLDESTDPGFEFRYIDIGTVGPGHLRDEPQLLAFEAAPSRARRRLRAGDTIISTVRTYLRSVWTVPRNPGTWVASTGFTCLRPSSTVDARFLGWVAQSNLVIDEIVARSVGVSYPAINPSEIGQIKIPLLPYSQQRAIADYLDRETARIDALVNAKRQMIDILDERTISLINEFTARGMRQTPRKETGIQWLGAIPAHWQTMRIRRLAAVRRGASPRPIDDPIYFDDNGDYAWVRISDVTASGRYLVQTQQQLSTLGSSLSAKLEPGSLFISIAGSVGKPIVTKIRACVHDGFVYFQHLRIRPDYLYFLFRASQLFQGLGKLGTQLNLNTETIGDIVIPVPPLDEQDQIVEALDEHLALIDRAKAQLTRQLALLQERRAGLITSAITAPLGKLEAA